MYRGSSTLLYIPAYTTVQDFQSTISHRGNLYRRGFVTTLGVPNSSLNLTMPLRQYNHNPPLPKRDKARSQQTNSTSHQREQTQPQPLPKREQPTNEGFYNKWYISTTNLFPFPQNNDPNRIGQKIAQVWKNQVFGKQKLKEIILRKLLKIIEMKNKNKSPKILFSLIFPKT